MRKCEWCEESARRCEHDVALAEAAQEGYLCPAVRCPGGVEVWRERVWKVGRSAVLPQR